MKTIPKHTARKSSLSFIMILAMVMFISTDWANAQITQPKAWTKAYDQVSGTASGTSFAIASGSNRILVVAISNSLASSSASSDPSTITYGGVTLTKATSNASTSGRMHAYLYYLKDNVVMDNTSRPLNVTISGTVLNMTVWYAVYAGVDQLPISYTAGNGLNNSGASGPAQLSTPMNVNTDQQAVYISSIYNDNSTTIPGYTINANWTSGGTNTGSSGGNSVAWKNEVAKRTIPGSNITDNAATSLITPSTRIRYAMSAMSLPRAATAPTITSFSPTSACTGSGTSVVITGADFTGATAVTFFNSQTATFVVNSSTQITATLPAAAGTGTISVTTPIGTGTSSSSFTVNSLPTVDAIAGGASSVCVNSITPAFTDATVGGSWSITPGTGTASITSGGVVTGLTAGTVTVVYTYSNGTCSNTASASLTVNPLPSVAPIADGASGVCVGTSTPAFTDATAGGSWSITDGTGTASIDGGGIVTGLTPGTVTVVYTYNGVTCSNTATTGLTVYSTITVNSTNVYSNSPTSAPICEGSTLELFAPPGGTSYAWFGPDGWTSPDQNPTITSVPLSAAGQYNVFIYSDCYPAGYAWATFVGLHARPSVPGLSGPSPVCINSTNNVYTTEASMSNYAWSVSPGGTITAGGGATDNTVTVTWNTAGPQFVKVNYTNSFGCYPVSDTQFNVTVNPFPVTPGTMTGPATVCPNAIGIQYSIGSVSGATVYTWTLPSDWSITLGTGTTNITVLPGNLAGNISVTADNLCGSSAPRSLPVTITVANDIGFNTNFNTNTLSICTGTTGTTIDGGNPSGSETSTWEVSTTLPSGPFATVSPNPGNTRSWTISSTYYNLPGTYYFRRVLSNNSICSGNSDVVTLTVNPRPVPIISGNNSVCQGSSNTYLTQAGMTNYVWAVSTGGSITGGGGSSDDYVTVTWTASGGTRFVRVNYNNEYGCNATTNTQFNVTVNAAPTATIGSDSPVCYGYNLNLSSGGGVSYSWSGPNGFSSLLQNPFITAVTPSASGIYSVNVTDGIGCSAVATTSVSIVPIIDIVASSDSPQCVGSSLNLSSTGGGTSYSWTGPNGFISTQQNPVIFPLTNAHNGLYIVTVATPTCGSITTATDVTINPLPSPNISGPSSTCLSITGDEYITDPGMTNYLWTVSPGGTIIAGGTSTSNTVTVKWNAHGSQSVSVNYTNSIGCSGGSTYNVTVILPFISSGPTSACVGSVDNVYSAEAGMTNYVWTVSAGGTITAGGGSSDNTVTVTWNTIGAQSVGVNYTTTEGCTAITPTIRNVTVNPLPVPTITGQANACQEGSTGFVYTTQPGMSNYIWTVSSGGIINSGTGTNSVNITWNSTGSQSVSVTYTNGNGCSPAVPTVYPVTVNPRPVPSITGPDFVCNGLSGVYTTEALMTGYTWGISGGGSITSGAGTNSVTITFTSTGDKFISVNYTSQLGCRPATASVKVVTVNAIPSPTITGPSPVCLNSTGNVYTTQAGNSGYSWSISGGNITAGTGTNSITVTWTSATNTSLGVNYMNSNNCTAASPATLNVTVIPLPSTAGTTITYGQTGSSGPLTFTSSCSSIVALVGPKNPSTGSNITGIGSVGWTGAGNITNVADNNYATITLGQNGETSNYLRGTSYGFAIPSGATINGIEVVINHETSGTTSPLIRDNRVSLVKAGVVQTTNYAYPTDNWSSTLGQATYGGPNDLWGTTWTTSDINNTNFGVVLSAINNNTSRSRDATVDYMQITVHYTLPGNIQWYAASSGGSPIFIGNPFNSLTESASGITNMSIPGAHTFYTVCSNAPDCRAPATLLIEKAEQTITWTPLTPITYGTPLSVAQLNASVAGVSGGALPGELIYTPALGTKLPAGPQTLHVTAAGTDYYNEASMDVLINVEKASLTVSATADSKIYDGLPTAVAHLTTDALFGDVVTASYVAANFADKNIGTGKIVTVTGISISGADAGNYNLLNTTATIIADITAKDLTVSATADNKTYDGLTTAVVHLTTDALLGDIVTAAYVDANFADKNVGTGKTVTVTGISISGADAGNYNLLSNTATTTANITAKDLTVSATADNKTYDGLTTAVAHLTTDALAGDVVTAAYINANFADKNIGSGKTVTVTGISISGIDAGNYNLLSTTATTTANITAKDLTVSATADNKAYDGLTTAVAHLTTDAVSGDVVTAAYLAANFADKNVGTGKTVTITGISISGADVGNYNLLNTTAITTADITAKDLTVSAIADNKTYDGLTTAVAHLTTDALLGDVVTAAYINANFADKNIGTGKTVTVTGISISGADAGNYNLLSTTAITTANITAKDLTVSATADNKPYDGLTTAVVHLTTDAAGGDVVTAAYLAANFADKNVGTGKTVTVTGISIGGADAGNYNLLNTTATTTADITAKDLTVSATADNKIYDGLTTAVAHLTTDALLGDIVTIAYVDANFADKNVGTGKTVTVTGISISGAGAGNYNLLSTTAITTANITAKDLTVSATADNKTYDGLTTAVAHLTTDALLGDVVTAGYVAANFADKNIGTGKTVSVTGISIGGADAGNYNLLNTTAITTANITAKGLTVSALADNKKYDGLTTAVAHLTTDAVSGDNVTAAYLTANFADKNVGNGKTVTVTGISIGGADAGNYNLLSTTAITTATITVKDLTVSATADNKTYDGLTTAVAHLTTDALLGDVVTAGYVAANFADKNVGNGKIVTVTGISIGGADAGNYNLLNTTAITTANITAKGLTVSATADNKTYDGLTTAVAHLTTDAVSGDVVTAAYLNANFADKNVGNGKTVTVTGISISGADAGNYNLLNTTATTTANITAISVTVTAAAKTKVYGDSDPPLTYTFLPALISGDSFTGSLTRDAGENVGNHAITQGTLALTNYNLVYVGANLSITARPITVTADAKTKMFGESDPPLTYKVTSGSLAFGEVCTGALARLAGENIGTYPINQGTLALTSNYALTFAGADFTITAKTTMPSVTVSPTSVQYSDQVTFTANISVGAMLISGRSHPEASVTFKVGNQEMGTVPLKVKGLDLEGKLTTAMVEKIKGQMAPGNKTVYAVFNFPNSKIKVSPNPATTNLTITREDARVNYTGSYLETASGSDSKSSGDHSNVFLRATVQDITAVRGDHDWDPFAGDIRNAKVRFLKGSVPITNWLTPDLVNGRDSKTGVVSAKWGDFGLSADIPGDINVEVGGNGYYVRNNPADLSVVTLYAPNGDYVAGGGYLVNPYHTDGTYAGDPGLKANFGFVVKYKNKGTNLQGNMDFIFRREVDGVIHTYQVNSTSITSLGVNVASHHALRALIVSNANLNDITDPGSPVLLGSLLKLQVSLTDNGESGVSDMIGISLWNGSTLLFSSNWTGSNTSEKQIGDGNLIVHSGLSFGDVNNPPDDHHNEHMLSAEIGVKAYPNPFTDHVYFELMLRTESKVRLEIFDITGARIATLFNDVVLAYNRYQLEYTPENFSSGVLLYRLIIDDQIAFTGKLIHK